MVLSLYAEKEVTSFPPLFWHEIFGQVVILLHHHPLVKPEILQYDVHLQYDLP